ncbi:beta-glucosidase BglX [Psychroflexus lacisalsi]|jgi:beta-glucosidase|uniref:beta-glucosidase n=1 Tax=Psychroflexus lacisalsi TaxID=503928 RepID=A0ABN1K451_9FLAO|nr:beta-glucosidase BglX [Psychroflexus lacisalsi]MBZ9618887.1 beta-glucosidase BglX [Psychroflexus lacisalsi]
MNFKHFIYMSIAILILSCQQNPANINSSKTIDAQVQELLAKMTLEEKIGQMNQYSGFMDFTGPEPDKGQAATKLDHIKKGWVGSMLNVHGVENVRAVQKIAVEESRLGIPLVFGFDVIHGYKTISPIPLAEAASWNLEAIKRSAEIAAEEASAAGINWTFAPMVDISRDARWGRVMEGAGEDPFLGSQIAKARINGFQGEDLAASHTIAATAKHFAGYGFAEAGRDYNTVDVGTTTLYNVILPPFEASLEADVKSVMSAFNVLNGIPATGDQFLLRNILKDQWDFQGFVVSDWDSVGEMVNHGYAEDGRDAAKKSVLAGTDMDMESYHFIEELASLVEAGEVDEDLIDDAARRVLKVKFELGLFEDPYKYLSKDRENELVYSPKFKDEVSDIARRSIVLLKNDNNILPLKKSNRKIAIIGDLAQDKTSPLGSWRIAADDGTAEPLVEAMQAYEANNTINYTAGPQLIIGETKFVKELKVNTTDRSGFDEAVKSSKNADVVIMNLGEHGLQSGEARSRTRLGLPGLQQELLEAVYKVNPNIVLVLQNGRPLTLNWAEKNIPAIVEAWQLGSFSGSAIAQVLYGDYNPSGKLPMSFPRHVGQLPLYYNHLSTGRPNDPNQNDVFRSHYTDELNTPLYPFGFGLSYTNFTYNNFKVTTQTSSNAIEVTVNVENSGDMDGTETVQVYIRDLVAQISRPVKELKAFQQVKIKAGEKVNLTFTLTEEDLGYYLPNGDWIFESGEFEIFLGSNSQDTSSKLIEL